MYDLYYVDYILFLLKKSDQTCPLYESSHDNIKKIFQLGW